MEKYDTLGYYNQNAESYFEATKDGNMQEIYDIFLEQLVPPAYILDFGCGSGRDSKHFIDQGYKVRAIDGSENLCKIASQYIGQEVEHMLFEELDDVATYDGIWACSSILHVERKKLPDILKKMLVALKETGTMYASFKSGDAEIIQEGKYYNYMTREMFEEMLKYVDPSFVVDRYFSNATVSNINRPTAIWGSYFVRKRTKSNR